VAGEESDAKYVHRSVHAVYIGVHTVYIGAHTVCIGVYTTYGCIIWCSGYIV